MVLRAWAGDYRHRVTIWRNDSSRTANTDGQRPEDAEQFCQRWASVQPVRAAERYLSQQVKHDVTHEVRMRRDSSTKLIDSSYWITLRDGTRLDVRSIYDVDQEQRELRLECNERS